MSNVPRLQPPSFLCHLSPVVLSASLSHLMGPTLTPLPSNAGGMRQKNPWLRTQSDPSRPNTRINPRRKLSKLQPCITVSFRYVSPAKKSALPLQTTAPAMEYRIENPFILAPIQPLSAGLANATTLYVPTKTEG